MAHLLGALGLNGPLDSMNPKLDNPDGFGESLGVVDIDDSLLFDRGGSWQCPPEEQLLDESDPHWIRQGRDAFITAFGEGTNARGWVLKDPRMCLLLSFWRRVLNRKHLRILCCFRSPEQVVDSMASKRRGISQLINTELSLANWERYNRSIVDSLQPDDTVLFADFERLLTDNAYQNEFASDLSRFLRPLVKTNARAVHKAITENLHWGKTTARRVPITLSPERSHLHRILEETAKQPSLIPPLRGPEDPATEILFAEHRRCRDKTSCSHVTG